MKYEYEKTITNISMNVNTNTKKSNNTNTKLPTVFKERRTSRTTPHKNIQTATECPHGHRTKMCRSALMLS